MSNGVVLFAEIIREMFDHFQDATSQWNGILQRSKTILESHGLNERVRFEGVMIGEFMESQRLFFAIYKDDCKEAMTHLEVKALKPYLGSMIQHIDRIKKHDDLIDGLAALRQMIEGFANEVFEVEMLQDVELSNNDLI